MMEEEEIKEEEGKKGEEGEVLLNENIYEG